MHQCLRLPERGLRPARGITITDHLLALADQVIE
jgi:hypothetical protein